MARLLAIAALAAAEVRGTTAQTQQQLRTACSDTLAQLCSGARRASSGDCYVCVGQHQRQAERAGCSDPSIDSWCGGGEPAPPPPPFGYSCAGHCGSRAENCWCNTECITHGDCCSDYQAACGGGGGSTVTTRYLVVGGHNRSYELHVPKATGSKKLPVILAFHGDGGTAAAQAADDQFRDVAGGVAIIVHGQGIGFEQKTGKAHSTWNGGGASMQSLGPGPHRIAPDGETCQQNITKGTLMVSCAKQIRCGP